ncbi:hypothetical protein Tco_0624939 [Tanacetum coccineum]|uniref:Uncharacterized protein n=1 Tax=Tanacetum coccineum TaxID=301880 RepID=A0ABQ4WFE0_9ASTR
MAALKYKDDHNKIAYLGRERGCEDFTDILGYLDHSPLRYALTHAPPVVFDSLVKQFWATAVVRPNAAGSHDLVATIDDREVVLDLSPLIGLRSANTFDSPMLAIAAAGDDAAGDDDAANEDTAAVNEAAGSAAEAPLVPHSPPVSPVREPTPEQQPVSQRPSSPSPTIPETEWVVPTPVSPVTDWRKHGPYVFLSVPYSFKEALFSGLFGPEPRPAGYVDPDVIEPIIFGPQPRPHGYVDPDFVEPIIFGPQPRPDNYLEPEDLDNITSMEDDTTHGGFHEESPVRPDDAPTPTADAAGRAEDPALLTSLSAKLDRVKKLEKTVKQLRDTRLVVDASAAEGDVDVQDDLDLDGLSRMASAALDKSFLLQPLSRFQVPFPAVFSPPTAVTEPLVHLFLLIRGKAPMLIWNITCCSFLAEDAQARQRLEEEQASERQKQLVLNLMMQVGSNPALAKELLGADVNEGNFIERMTAVRNGKGEPCEIYVSSSQDVKAMNQKQLVEEYEYICRRLEKDRLLSAQYNLFRPKPAITEPPSKRQRVEHVDFSNPAGHYSNGWLSASRYCWWVHLMLQASSSTVNVSIDHIPIDVLFESTVRFCSCPGFDEWEDCVYVCGQGLSYPGNSGLNRMFRHRLTVPPSYCRDVVVAGNIIQTVQDGLRQAYECLASAPIACTARQMVFSSPWLTAKKESGSPLQTAWCVRLKSLMR